MYNLPREVILTTTDQQRTPASDTSTSGATASAEARSSVDTGESPSKNLERIARTLRRHIISMTATAGSGHPGGSLSAVEIITCLFFQVLRCRASDPEWVERDRFILSKGHAAPLLYAALAETGYLPVGELCTLREMDSRLQGHPDKTCTPGVEMTCGSLGQGLSFGIGVALAARLNSQSYRVYVLLGDGECDEGQVWEAAMSAAHFKIDNLVAIIDHNKLQIDGWNREVMNLEPFPDKWRAFGWHVVEVNGHDIPQLLATFEEAEQVKGRPTAIIAHTIKGKGVSFMENKVDFHGKAPTPEEADRALKELA
jgi:transketolase